MGIRFNKRMTLLPWLKMNVSKSGVSFTIGPKGKTLNIGSTGVSVNVSLGKGVGYSQRLISWKSLNLLSILGIGGAAAAKNKKGKTAKGRKSIAPKNDTTIPKNTSGVPSLDEAIAEAEAQRQDTSQPVITEIGSQPVEERGCSWGCAAIGCLALLVILALLAFFAYLLWQQYGNINS